MERFGYVYFINGFGEGTPKFKIIAQRSNMSKEFVGFLYFDYNFCENDKNKSKIIEILRMYNEIEHSRQLKNFRTHFEVLNIKYQI